jgi:hypothetical protein
MVGRSRLALRLVTVLGLAALSACAAPSSFEGLTGGNPKPENELRTRATDPTMDAPRPIAPISVSWVATARPTFRWAHAPGSTGAVLELCRTRACDGDVRRIDVEGETITVPEDLEPGVWFWRVFGTSKERVGTKPSATWELVVRGAGSKASSDAPSGSIVDVNGDGLPDLVVTSEGFVWDENDQSVLAPDINVYFGEPDGKLHTKDTAIGDPYAEVGDDELAAIDTDGDGFTDVARSLKLKDTGEHIVTVQFGAPGKAWQVDDMSGFDYFDWDKHATILLPGNTIVPGVREGGDINGDGYGDVIVAGGNASVIGLGGAKGSTLTMPLGLAMPGQKPSTALVGGFDLDGDGLSDLAFPSVRAGSVIAAARGDRERVQVSEEFMANDLGTVEKPLAFVSGDFDGDGITDIAATVNIDGRRNVCIWRGDRDKLFVPFHCIRGFADDPLYGQRLAVGDLTAKGRDDILVSGSEGASGYVDIIGIEGENGIMLDTIRVPGIGGKLTTIWPGRPGKARWATVDAAGTAILVFEGRTQIQSLAMIGRFPDFGKKVRSLR